MQWAIIFGVYLLCVLICALRGDRKDVYHRTYYHRDDYEHDDDAIYIDRYDEMKDLVEYELMLRYYESEGKEKDRYHHKT